MSRPPDPPALTEPHRRCLRRFARWFAAAADAGPTTYGAILELARTIDAGGMGEADANAAIDALDDLLSGVWDRRPSERDR